jgi:hypothetical protein
MSIPGAIDSLFYAKQSGSYTVMIVDSGCPEHSQGINVYFAVGLAEQPPKKLPLYPNPTTGILTIKGVEGTIAVYNIYGERIATILSTTTDLPQAAIGIYFVRVLDGQGKVYMGKVLKEWLPHKLRHNPRTYQQQIACTKLLSLLLKSKR